MMQRGNARISLSQRVDNPSSPIAGAVIDDDHAPHPGIERAAHRLDDMPLLIPRRQHDRSRRRALIAPGIRHLVDKYAHGILSCQPP